MGERPLAMAPSQLDEERHAATLAERGRLAREMHDSLAQMLSVAHLRLRALEDRAVDLDPEIVSEIGEVAQLCLDAYTEVRENIAGLRASTCGCGLASSVPTFVRVFERTSGVPTTVEIADDIEVGLEVESQVVRIIQEALTNVRKHAGASAASVLVAAHEGRLLVEVVDDGVGFARDAAGFEEFGIHVMHERAALIGGGLEISSIVDSGTTVRLSVPLREHA